tara:strand:+ start:1347 stop:1682 length:336 start_codon:yes stop_codon:yes gene_type:complete
MEYLFSYGTLQQKNVQLESFGRTLEGSKDVLQKYIVKELEITDEHVLRLSNKKFHPILFFTNNEEDEVKGTLFKVTSAELLKADDYEVDDYERRKVMLKSGTKSWIYLDKN